MYAILTILLIILFCIHLIYKWFTKNFFGLHLQFTKYGSINIYNDFTLVVIIYPDKTLDWFYQPTIIQYLKIVTISNNFDKYFKQI